MQQSDRVAPCSGLTEGIHHDNGDRGWSDGEQVMGCSRVPCGRERLVISTSVKMLRADLTSRARCCSMCRSDSACCLDYYPELLFLSGSEVAGANQTGCDVSDCTEAMASLFAKTHDVLSAKKEQRGWEVVSPCWKHMRVTSCIIGSHFLDSSRLKRWTLLKITSKLIQLS